MVQMMYTALSVVTNKLQPFARLFMKKTWPQLQKICTKNATKITALVLMSITLFML
jgi:hypothetical protein